MAKVMIVDDAAFIRELIRGHLVSRGHSIVAEAGDGELAVRLALEKKPEVIIMDLILPRKNGMTAAQEIKQALPSTRIIAISSADQESLLSKALDNGFSGYIAKPFEKEELIRTVEAKN